MITRSILARLLILILFLLPACSPISLTTGNLPAGNAEVTVVNNEPQPVSISSPISTPSNIELQTSLINIYQRANPAVVYIITRTGTGSGFVFDLEGHIVTNNHVVMGGNEFEVVFSNQDRARATLVGSDPDSDLAVIKVAKLPNDLIPLRLAPFDSIQVGQIVLAIGNPFGEQGSMSMGIVSGVGRTLPSQRISGPRSTYSLPEVIQTDAPINPGNSGGPLLNLDGEVIGVNSAISTDTGTNSGVGFAIPVNAVQRIIPQLIEYGEYTYSYMGVGFDNEISLNEQSLYGVSQTQGAYVLNVTPGSPADKAGLIPADSSTGQGGDLIVAIDGQSIKDFAELNSYLVFHTSPDQTIELTIIRPDGQVSILLTLGARP